MENNQNLKVLALPAPLNVQNILRGSWSANWGNQVLSEGHSVYCKICERLVSNREREFNSIIYHVNSHFEPEYRNLQNLRDVAEYLIIVDNAAANRLVHSIERKIVAAVKQKGEQVKCDICNKNITKTPDKARHIASHFADKQLPAEWKKYLIVSKKESA